ncbi:MAG: hypothetical protein RBR97_07165 [Bacteroidales bacterium]|nr:hypothetical protein [Bacteroidales bacterium]
MIKIGKKYSGSKFAIKVHQQEDAMEVVENTISQVCDWLRNYGYENTAKYLRDRLFYSDTQSMINLDEELTNTRSGRLEEIENE